MSIENLGIFPNLKKNKGLRGLNVCILCQCELAYNRSFFDYAVTTLFKGRLDYDRPLNFIIKLEMSETEIFYIVSYRPKTSSVKITDEFMLNVLKKHGANKVTTFGFNPRFIQDRNLFSSGLLSLSSCQYPLSVVYHSELPEEKKNSDIIITNTILSMKGLNSTPNKEASREEKSESVLLFEKSKDILSTKIPSVISRSRTLHRQTLACLLQIMFNYDLSIFGEKKLHESHYKNRITCGLTLPSRFDLIHRVLLFDLIFGYASMNEITSQKVYGIDQNVIFGNNFDVMTCGPLYCFLTIRNKNGHDKSKDLAAIYSDCFSKSPDNTIDFNFDMRSFFLDLKKQDNEQKIFNDGEFQLTKQLNFLVFCFLFIIKCEAKGNSFSLMVKKNDLNFCFLQDENLASLINEVNDLLVSPNKFCLILYDDFWEVEYPGGGYQLYNDFCFLLDNFLGNKNAILKKGAVRKIKNLFFEIHKE
jgi:hypothetical protein